MAALAAEVAAHHGFPVDNLATPGADADYLRDRNTRGRVYAGVSELRDVDLESPSQVPARQRVSHGVHERPRVRPRGQSTEVFVQAQRQPDRERPTSNAPRTASRRCTWLATHTRPEPVVSAPWTLRRRRDRDR